MSLADPTKKMSKSLGPKHYIALTDSPTEIKKKIASAVTDSGHSGLNAKRSVRVGDMSPGVQNLFNMLEIFATVGIHKKLISEYKNNTLKYVDLKTALSDAIIKHLRPIQAKRKELEQNRGQIAEILIDGAKKAKKIADKTMDEIRKKIGIR